MEIEIKLQVEEGTTQEQLDRYGEIFNLLVKTGALDGVKGGRTVIHFDEDGNFRGIICDYWVWKKREV